MEIDWAIQAVGHDYNSHRILTGQEAIDLALGECKFHQGPKVRGMLKRSLIAALDDTELPEEWRETEDDENEEE